VRLHAFHGGAAAIEQMAPAADELEQTRASLREMSAELCADHPEL
jgi:hypothetical protein